MSWSERHVGARQLGANASLDLFELVGRGAMPRSAIEAGKGMLLAAARAGPVRSQATFERHALAVTQRPHAAETMLHHGMWIGAPRAAFRAAQAVGVHRLVPRLMRAT